MTTDPTDPTDDRTPARIVERTTELEVELELASRCSGIAPTLDELATALEVDRSTILAAGRVCGATAVASVLVVADAMLLLHTVNRARPAFEGASAALFASHVRQAELGSVRLILASMAGEH